jgi:hypothetical protein
LNKKGRPAEASLFLWPQSGKQALPLYWRFAETLCRFSGIAAGNPVANP